MFYVVGMDRFIRVGPISWKRELKLIKQARVENIRGVDCPSGWWERGRSEVGERRCEGKHFSSSTPVQRNLRS